MPGAGRGKVRFTGERTLTPETTGAGITTRRKSTQREELLGAEPPRGA
jgi:hypothetical protein